MSIAQATPAYSTSSPRWLLLGSLALNLFFIGIAVALALRGPAQQTSYDRNVFVRVDRLAATLPAADGEKLRWQINANRDAVQSAQAKYRAAQDLIRAALRKEPFDAEAMRSAMAQTRATRQNFDQSIQSVVAAAAADMTAAGRNALADWPPNRKADGN